MSDGPVLTQDVYSVRPIFHTRSVSIRQLLSLRFSSPSLELGFSQYYLPVSLFQSRLAFGLAPVFLLSDYVADSIFYGLAANSANIMRVSIVGPAFLCFFVASYLPAIKRRYEMHVAIFYTLSSSFMCYVLYLLDNAGGSGISNTVGFLNLVFLLTFGFVMIGVRFNYSLVSSAIVSLFYILMLYNRLGVENQLYYFSYQILTVFLLFAILGYTREFVLRVDFATQIELAEAREALARQSQGDTRYLAWLRQLAEFLRHEVRQSVAQINSSIEVAQLACKDNSSVAPYLATAALGSQQVWNLVERASRATDAEAFVRQCQPQWIDLNHLISEQVQAFQQTSSGIEFRLQSPATVQVYCDPNLIKEAVGNLLSNASSFAVEDSAIDVSILVNHTQAIIRVTNRGPPIEGNAETLFGPFASTRSGPLSEHQGLGLYLVRLIAEQHGGTTTIANLADRSGVQARISLPLATQTPNDHPPTDSRGRART